MCIRDRAIAYCAEKGIIGGTGDGKFEPEKNILREEAAKIIAVALKMCIRDRGKTSVLRVRRRSI